MSATNRGAARIEHDNYETPAWCVHRLLETGALPLPGSTSTPDVWLDPCAGSGAIIRAANYWFRRNDAKIPVWHAVEIRPCDAALRELGAEVTIADFLGVAAPCSGTLADVIIMNPPFSLAREFIDRCLGLSDIVAALLRLNFLASASRRADFMRWGTPDVYVLPNRPSFVSGRTDATEYAWMVWDGRDDVNNGSLSILPLTPREERRQP